MLFQPAIIALLLAGAVSLLVLVAATPFVLRGAGGGAGPLCR